MRRRLGPSARSRRRPIAVHPLRPAGSAGTLAAAAALCLALTPTTLQAQVIRGWVVLPDRSPIPDAEVLLTAEDGATVARATSDEMGRFELTTSAVGRMRLEASHIGYADWETATFDLDGDADLEVLVRLDVAPIPLEEVRVETRARLSTRRLADFERRMERQAFGGHFIVEEDIARRPASRPSNLPLATPGITVRGGGTFDLYRIYTGDCLANVFIDGVRIDQVVTSVDEYLTLDRIAGVEVYPRSMSAPPQYQDAGRRECGSVVYWTKELQPDRDGGWSTTKVTLGVGALVGLLALGLVR